MLSIDAMECHNRPEYLQHLLSPGGCLHGFVEKHSGTPDGGIEFFNPFQYTGRDFGAFCLPGANLFFN